jgi:hypothetical protein
MNEDNPDIICMEAVELFPYKGRAVLVDHVFGDEQGKVPLYLNVEGFIKKMGDGSHPAEVEPIPEPAKAEIIELLQHRPGVHGVVFERRIA